MRIRLLIVCAVIGTSALGSYAAEMRRHYVIAERNRTDAFEVTTIHRGDPAAVTRTYLIADQHGPLLRIDVANEYARRQTTSTFALLRGSRDTAKIILDLPVTSTTLEGRREELRKHPELDDLPVPVTIETARQTIRGHDHDWREPATRDAQRTRVRQMLGGEMVAALGGIRELAGLPMFADLNPALGYVFDESTLVRRSLKLMAATVRADCRFDARFDVPCAK